MEPSPGYVPIDKPTSQETEPIVSSPHVNGNAPAPVRNIVRLEDIAAADDVKIEWVSVPEWAPAGSSQDVRDTYGMYLRSMNGRERAQWHTDVSIQKGKNTEVNFLQLHVSIIVIAACDEKGNRIYTDADKKILLRKNSAVLSRLAAKAGELSEIGEEEIETLTGNSSASLADE